ALCGRLLFCAEAVWSKPRMPSKTIKLKNSGRVGGMRCITALDFKPRAACAQLELPLEFRCGGWIDVDEVRTSKGEHLSLGDT
ncbi:MAG TPA: hypothetical protein VN833_23980, partial [Candidatus Acidoferrales bacterium]|nr:hypothetical protein [Candidatus Acidoferrales bacterium]